MEIRFAKKEDGEAVLALFDELLACGLKSKQQPVVLPQNNEQRLALFLKTVTREDIKYFLAEENGEVVGVADVHIYPVVRRGTAYARIEDFVVSEKMRGKGIGGKLLEHIKEYCREYDIHVIKLTSAREFLDAHKFYEKHGGVFEEKMFRFDV